MNVDSREELVSTFKALISPDLANLSKSIGIVCYDNDYLKEAEKIIDAANLPEDLVIKLDSTKRITYLPKGVYLMSIDDCKGLEFSKIYILGLNASKIKTKDEARRGFVAVTRAMNELVVLGQN